MDDIATMLVDIVQMACYNPPSCDHATYGLVAHRGNKLRAKKGGYGLYLS